MTPSVRRERSKTATSPPTRGESGNVRAWVLYDFANSVFPAVMTTAMFPVFFKGLVGGDAGEGDALWGRAVSLSALIVAATAPVLGAISDRCGGRKLLMSSYVLLAVCSVGLLWQLEAIQGWTGLSAVWVAFALFVLSNVGYESANVFYNAYLPDIAPPERQGRVSAWGFGLGYLGSALGLLGGLVLFQLLNRPIEEVWLFTAAFFLVLSIPALKGLPRTRSTGIGWGQAARTAPGQLIRTIKKIWRLRSLRRFLGAYFFFIDGVLTIIAMAAIVAVETFGFSQEGVIMLFFVVQFSALVGAFLAAKPTDLWGPKPILLLTNLLWIAMCVLTFFAQSRIQFTLLAVAGGLGLGGVQSASRALMARLVPKGQEEEMFGFYALCGKSSSILGPLIFGQIVLLSDGNQRPAFLFVALLFVVGILLLQGVKQGATLRANALNQSTAP